MKKLLLVAAIILAISSCKKMEITNADESILSSLRTSTACLQQVGISGVPVISGYTVNISYTNPDNKKKVFLLKVINNLGVMITDEAIKVNGGSGTYTFSITSGDGPWLVSVTDPCNGAYVAGQYGQ